MGVQEPALVLPFLPRRNVSAPTQRSHDARAPAHLHTHAGTHVERAAVVCVGTGGEKADEILANSRLNPIVFK